MLYYIVNRTVPGEESCGRRELSTYATGLVEECAVFHFYLLFHLQPHGSANKVALVTGKMIESGPRGDTERRGKRGGRDREKI